MESKSPKQLYRKLFLIYTAIIVSIVSAMVVYFISSIRSQTLSRNLDYTEKMMSEASSYLLKASDTANYLQLYLYNSSIELWDVIHYLEDDVGDYLQYRLDAFCESPAKQYNGIGDFATNALEAYSNIKRIEFVSYSKEETISYYQTGNCYSNKNIEDLMNRIKSGDLAAEGEFSFLKEIRNPQTLNSTGCMIFTFSNTSFPQVESYYPQSHLAVYNQAATIVYMSSDEDQRKNITAAKNIKQMESSLNAHIYSQNVADYTVLAYIEKNHAADIPPALLLTVICVGTGVLILGEFMVKYYLQNLKKRLNYILAGMEQVTTGDLTVRLDADQNGDELDVISEHFNEMCKKLSLYIRKSYLAEIEQKNAEMDALQSQINPHFLYNTLEVIRMRAICNGDREVGKMLYSMSVLYRSQLKEDDIVTLAQELHYCKKYLELFEIRYNNKFISNVKCSEKYMRITVIKFILQPIIENYFMHGIRNESNDNYINISVEKDQEDMRIIVEDNGRGMEEEEIEKKNRELRENVWNKSKSIGIENVNRRLKAVYGQEYGAVIEKRSAGIRVILHFRESNKPPESKGIVGTEG